MRNAKKILDEYSGGSLDLSGCDLSGITLPTSIGGSIDLSGITLPTSIGGSIDLSGCENVPNGVYNCGGEKRTIAVYNHPGKGLVITLGCFVGSESEAIAAIKNKYRDTAACTAYCAKVEEAFAKIKT